MPEWLVNAWNLAYGAGSVVVSLGILGALISLAWNVWKDRQQRRREREREERQRQIERRGLLTLLAREIEMYERQWEVFEEDPTWVVQAPEYLLSTKVWEDARMRLSQLLEVNEFADMIRLFQNVNVLQEMRQRTDLYPIFVPGVEAGDQLAFGQRIVEAKHGVAQFKKQTAAVKDHMRRYSVSEDDLKGSLEGSTRPPANSR